MLALGAAAATASSRTVVRILVSASFDLASELSYLQKLTSLCGSIRTRNWPAAHPRSQWARCSMGKRISLKYG